MIPVYKPYLPSYVLKYAHDVIDSGWISCRGPYVEKTTEKLQELLNVKHALLVSNGTCATHLVAKGLKYKYNNINNIIVPNNVYVAAWNSFLYDGQFDLEVLDTDLDTWNADLSSLEVKENSALLAVHNIGNVINIPRLKEKYPSLLIVEDNCEGFLGKYDNKYSGTESLLSSISFFGNKNITSGEGGAVLTNDDDIFDYITKVYGQGMTKTKFIHDTLGYNYRMTNVQAAILYGQLKHLNEILYRKEVVFDTYKRLLSGLEDKIAFQKVEEGTKHSNWMFGIRIKGNVSYNKAEKYFTDCGVEIRPMFYDIDYHKHISISKDNRKTKNGLLLNDEVIILPSYPTLTLDELQYICNCIKNYVNINKNNLIGPELVSRPKLYRTLTCPTGAHGGDYIGRYYYSSYDLRTEELRKVINSINNGLYKTNNDVFSILSKFEYFRNTPGFIKENHNNYVENIIEEADKVINDYYDSLEK